MIIVENFDNRETTIYAVMTDQDKIFDRYLYEKSGI